MAHRSDPACLSRRSLLRAIPAAGAVTLLAGAPRARAAGEELTIFTWETYHDDDWLKQWTGKSGVKVNVIRSGSADEMYAKLRSGSVEADIVWFDVGSIPRYMEANLIAPVDVGKVSNASNITSGLRWQDRCTVAGKVMAVPYNWGTQPLMFNTSVVQPKPDSWAVLWDTKYAGKVNLPDASDIAIPMVALYVGAKNPYDMSDAEFDKVAQALRDLRPQLRTMARGFDDATVIYASGDADLGYCQNISEVFQLQGQGKPFDYAFPKEGTPAWIDCAIVTTKGAGRQVVYDFINENLTPAWQARFIKSSLNNGVLSPPAATAAGVPDDVLKKTNIPAQSDAAFWNKMSLLQNPNKLDRRLEIWNAFKAGTL